MTSLKHYSALCAFLPMLIGVFSEAQSEENLWIYTRGTDTRPQGSTELRFSTVSRLGKDSGDYAFHDIRPGIEYGITDRLTLGGSLIVFQHDYAVDDPDLNPMYETQGGTGGSFDDLQIGGFRLSSKYNILSPYKDLLGLSIGLGYERRDKYRLDGGDIDQDSYTGTVFLQKNWLDNTLVLAVNGTTELERRRSEDVLEEEIAFDVSAGLSYRFMPRHFIGIEYRRQQDHLSPYNTDTDQYDDPALDTSEWDLGKFSLGTRHQYGEYIGPSYHYAQKNWWITTGILFQVQGGGSRHAYVKDSKNYDEHEEIHVGFSYGYEF